VPFVQKRRPYRPRKRGWVRTVTPAVGGSFLAGFAAEANQLAIMLRKNVASQVITFNGVNATSGAALTGATVTTKVALDGTQSASAGTLTELGTGQYKYVPTQAETNGGSVGFSFTATNMVPVNIHCFTIGQDPAAAQLAANVTQLLGTAWLTPGTAGTPDVNVKLWNGLATVALPLVPTTAGRTLDVSATGEAGVDWANVGSPTTAVDLSGTTIKTTQKVDVDTIKTNPVVNAGTITFPTTATLASTTNITAGTITTATNVTTVNGLAAAVITAASIAADAITDAKVAADVTIASVTGAVGSVTGAVGSVTGAVGSVTGAVGSVTGNVGGNVTGSIGSVAAGGIATTSFAAGAIDAAAIAADAIGSSELAATAATEIANAVAALACTEPTAVVAASPTLIAALSWLLTLSRNKVTQTSTTQIVKADDGSTTVATSTHSDDGTTHTRGEFA
jgi:hypothetical protein